MANEQEVAQRIESLGPAERMISTLIQHVDHLYHNRPGYVAVDQRTKTGVRWHPVTWIKEEEQKVVYRLDKVGKKERKIRIGILGEDNVIREGNTVVGEYRKPGIFREVAIYLYREIAKVWEMDNEFAAKWASYAYKQENRDLKTLLSAFMLVQSRKGDPVRSDDGSEILFHDDDYRDVGEAMCLIFNKDGKNKNGHNFDPKQLSRIFDVLAVPEIAQINRELGFTRAQSKPFLGRAPKVVEKWLRYREQNLPILQGLMKAGRKKLVMKLAQRVGYKPQSPEFFKVMRWKQEQANDGHRTLAIGEAVKAADTWEGLSEREICQQIMREKPSYKVITGKLPADIGLTAAIMAAAVEAGSLSDQDLVILSITLEDLGLLKSGSVKERWERATLNAKNQRALNISERAQKKETVEKLQEAADVAIKAAVEEVVKDLRIYVMVDKSGSMHGAIERAKYCLSRFLQAFPLDRLHVATFNTHGKVINIKHASTAGVEQAFRGEQAGGGTVYASGVNALQQFKPQDDEDVLFIFIGDQLDSQNHFAPTVRNSGLRPSAFGLLYMNLGGWAGMRRSVEETARQLEIPCFMLDDDIFDDPYAVTETLRHLIESTPVGQTAAGKAISRRKSLVETILSEPLLQKPTWA